MQLRTLLPTVGGILAIFIARSQEWSALATFAAMLGGLAIGWGLTRMLNRNG